jgi:NAD(P)H dehydrogenase (quinone)
MPSTNPILVTGAAGKVGAVGRSVVELLRKRDLPVRAFVRRRDERSDALKEMGADLFVGDLTSGADVARSLAGCKRMYFGMSVSPPYLEATVIAGAAAREITDFEILVNISQMTVSQMDLRHTTESPQQKQHWLAEQALNWSGLPVVHIRSTVFLEHFFFSRWAAESIAKSGTISLPFGRAKTSPVAAYDVARVVATILENPKGHAGKVYELTGPRAQDMDAIAKEYQEALGCTVKYVAVPFGEWTSEFESRGLAPHLERHVFTMAKLHADNRYDRFTTDVEKVTGTPSMSIRDYVKNHPELFAAVAPARS